MATRVKIVRIGDEEGILLPDDLLARLQWAPGDSLWPTDIADGVVLTKRTDAPAAEAAGNDVA